MTRWTTLGVILALVAAGCSGKTGQTGAETASTAKTVLEGIAQSGDPIGAEANDLRAAFETMKESDTAKGEKLLKELDELTSLTNATKIKAKASAMAARL